MMIIMIMGLMKDLGHRLLQTRIIKMIKLIMIRIQFHLQIMDRIIMILNKIIIKAILMIIITQMINIQMIHIQMIVNIMITNTLIITNQYTCKMAHLKDTSLNTNPKHPKPWKAKTH